MLAGIDSLSPELSDVSLTSDGRQWYPRMAFSKHWAPLSNFSQGEVLKRLPKDGGQTKSKETFDCLIEDLAQENIHLRKGNRHLSEECEKKGLLSCELEAKLENAIQRIEELEGKLQNNHLSSEVSGKTRKPQEEMPVRSQSRTSAQELADSLISNPIDLRQTQDIFARRDLIGRRQPGLVLECLDILDHLSSQELEGSERRILLDAARKNARTFLPKY